MGAPAGAPPGGPTAPPQGGFGAPPQGGQQGFGAPPAGQPPAPMAAAPPQKKKTNPLIYVGIGCALLFLLSCIGGNLYWFIFAPDADDVEEMVEEANEAAETGGGGDTAGETGGGGGGVCDRAADCCTAYVEEMGAAAAGVSSTCGNYRSMAGGPAEAGCQSAIDGWRSGLEAMGRTVPAACQ